MTTRRELAQSKIPSSAYKMVVFTAVTVLMIGVLATLIGNISFASAKTYHALFTDATGVNKGDRVRLSGVQVGSVRDIEIVRDGDTRLAKLTFTVEDGVPLYPDAELTLRYENIVGQRYLAIAEQPGERPEMPAGGTFPLAQTTPALSLTELFNGFQPLFRALDPETLNEFSFQLVRALQGEAGTVQALMRDTAELTSTIADRDELIGQVVTNLDTVLRTVGERDEKLTDLIVQFRDLMSGLDDDSDAIAASFTPLERLLGTTDGFLRDTRVPLREDIAALGEVAGDLRKTRDVLRDSLATTPDKLRILARTGSYGSWFNFYVCGAEVRLQLLGGTVNLGTPAFATNERDTVCGGGIE